jgi:hypothetical protein
MVLTHFSIAFPQTNYTALFYTIPLKYLQLKVKKKVKKCIQNIGIDGNYPKRQAETPKEKRLGFGSRFGHFHLCYRGDKFGNPLKVNIS